MAETWEASQSGEAQTQHQTGLDLLAPSSVPPKELNEALLQKAIMMPMTPAEVLASTGASFGRKSKARLEVRPPNHRPTQPTRKRKTTNLER